MRHLSLVLSCAVITALAAAPGLAESPQQWYRDGAALRGNEKPAN